MRLGHVLRVYRQAERLSLRELASDIGIDHNTLSRLERGDGEHGIELWIIVTNWLAGKQ
jgi:transcriptional regulator with XRE-family HTH domain